MKILIGVDGSAHAKAALEFVKSMPWSPDTRFVVLSVARPQVVGYTLVDAGVMSWMRAAEQDALEQAQELTARVARELHEAGLSVEPRVARGDPREALVDEVRNLGADLLVVGSHGRTGLDKLLLGSVASHLVGHAPCSVLVVKLEKK